MQPTSSEGRPVPMETPTSQAFFDDATQGWEYYLGTFYVLFNVLIIWRAYTWPRDEQL